MRYVRKALQAGLYFLSMLDLLPLLKSKKRFTILVTSYYDLVPEIFLHACYLLGFRYSIVFHGLDLLLAGSRQHRRFDTLVAHADQLIFNSLATERLFNKQFPHLRRNSSIVNPGIDLQGLQQTPLLTLHQLEETLGVTLKHKTIFCSIVRLVERKGLDTGILAMRELVDQYPDLVYLIGGTGSDAQRLLDLIGKAELEQHVYLLGNLTEQVKCSLLNISSIFLMPTRSLHGKDFEGFGISYLEAGFFGNASIGGSSGGEKEAILDGVTGYTYDFDRVDGPVLLANVLRDLLNDRNKLGQLQTQAKQHVTTHFDWPQQVDLFVRALDGFARN